jgi:hypothetical protein
MVVVIAGVVALDDQVLAVLRDAEGFPVATADVVTGVGAAPSSNRALAVGRRLRALQQRGEVARETVEGFRSVYWRLAEPRGENSPCE